jgi:cytochrome c biogenesis protein CcmG/thiol:disulfide interchange protein DsbE
MMPNPIAVAGGACAIALSMTLGTATLEPPPISPTVSAVASRKPAPALSLKDTKGVSQKLSNYKGRVVLLDFWATWCTGCKLEIPWFMEFEKKYGARGLSAIGVAVDEEGWRTVKAYLAEHPITYPVVMGDMDLMEKKFGLPLSLPVTLLIDRNGRIALTHAGVVEKEKFEADIRQLLDERAQ